MDDGSTEKNDLKKYVCEVCGKKFAQLCQWKSHSNNLHCLECGKSFPTEEGFEKHINTIGHKNMMFMKDFEERYKESHARDNLEFTYLTK